MKANYLIKHFTGLLVFFSLIFISAGRICYWQGWVYVVIGIIMLILNYTLLKIHDDLLNERSNPAKDSKKWDKIIIGLLFLLSISMYVVAGLDSGRYQWSPDFHPVLIYTGIIFTVSGQLLFLTAQKQNKFFSSTVRIQTDRRHTVCDTGVYNIVRHPAYLGMIIQLCGFPLLFGSLWCIIPVFISIILIVIRTFKEDIILKKELNAYTEYSKKTRYRIIPFIW